MEEYLEIFKDSDYPTFIDKYLQTPTLLRIKNVTQFCGADYTKLYSPRFKYSRYDHCLVSANMTWSLTHDKKQTLAALFHDAGTPCFAHCIDYVFGDYIKQESSEKDLRSLYSNDRLLPSFLHEDGVTISELEDLTPYHILENSSPRLCIDRLDGVLHTAYIWLHTHSLSEIKEVWNGITILTNEDGLPEIGFKDIETANRFVEMVYIYATELQGNKDKYMMKYISELIKKASLVGLLSLDDLYSKKEDEIISILDSNFKSWKLFQEARTILGSEDIPNDRFYISFATKKRNTIPLVHTLYGDKRINEISDIAKLTYKRIDKYKDYKYGYLDSIMFV